MKKSIKLLALLLAIMMCIPVFAACNPTGNGGTTTTADPNAAQNPGEPSNPDNPSNPADPSDPADPSNPGEDDGDAEMEYTNPTAGENLGGITIRVLYNSNTGQDEFFAKEGSADIVSQAINNRNIYTEENLSCKFDFIPQPGDYNNQASYVSAVATNIRDASLANTYDVFAAYSMAGGTLAVRGFCTDLLEYDSMTFEEDTPWWPQSLLNEAIINNSLLFCTGDIATSLIYQLHCIAFNKKMLEANGLEDPYELVRADAWTVEKMFTMCEGIYDNTDGVDGKTDGDTYGFVINGSTKEPISVDAFFFAAGLRTIEKDAEGVPQISASFGSSTTQDLLARINTFLNTDDGSRLYTVTPFAAERALFALVTPQNIISTTMRDSKVEYGILPMPMWNPEIQDGYYTAPGFPYNLYMISINSVEAEGVATALECLAYESWKLVSPALFEDALKFKYAKDSETGEMYDIIRAGAVIDIGRIFCSSVFNNATYTLFRNAVRDNKSDWASVFAGYDESLAELLEKEIVDVIG